MFDEVCGGEYDFENVMAWMDKSSQNMDGQDLVPPLTVRDKKLAMRGVLRMCRVYWARRKAKRAEKLQRKSGVDVAEDVRPVDLTTIPDTRLPTLSAEGPTAEHPSSRRRSGETTPLSVVTVPLSPAARSVRPFASTESLRDYASASEYFDAMESPGPRSWRAESFDDGIPEDADDEEHRDVVDGSETPHHPPKPKRGLKAVAAKAKRKWQKMTGRRVVKRSVDDDGAWLPQHMDIVGDFDWEHVTVLGLGREQ